MSRAGLDVETEIYTNQFLLQQHNVVNYVITMRNLNKIYSFPKGFRNKYILLKMTIRSEELRGANDVQLGHRNFALSNIHDHEFIYLYPLLQNTLSEIQFEYWFPKQYQSVKKLDSVN